MIGAMLRNHTAPPWFSSRRNAILKEGEAMGQAAFHHRIQAIQRRLEALRQAALSKSDQEILGLEPAEEYAILLEELGAAQEEYWQEQEEVLAARRAADAQRVCYRELLDFAPDGYLLTDTDGVIQEANRAALHLLGTNRDLLQDQPLDAYVSPQDRGSFHDLLARLKAGGEIGGQKQVLYLQPWVGSAFPVALSVAPRHEPEGCPLGLLWRLDDLRTAGRGGVRERLMLELAEDVQSLEDLILALERERETLLLIMENTDAQLAYLDPDFNFILVNSAYARGARHTVQELVGRNHFDLFPNAENEAIFEGVRDFGRPVQYRARPFEYHDRPELGITYWDWTLVPVKDAHGTVRGLVLSLVDVTDRVRAGQEREGLLAENQRQRLLLERLVETAPIGIAVVRGPDHRYELVNPYYQALLDPPGVPIVGRTFAEVLPEVAAQGTTRLLEEAYHSGRMLSIDGFEASIGPGGEEAYWNLDIVPLSQAGVDEQRALVLVHDVTEREREQQARQRLIAILEATPDVVATASSDGQVLYLNRAGREILGIPEDDDLAGWTISDCHPAWADRIVHDEGIPTSVQEGPWHGETAILSQDGVEIPVSQVILAHKAPDGSVEYLSTIMRDMRERKKIEGDLSKYARRLEVLHSVDHAIIAAESADAVAEIALSHIRQALPCLRASVALFDLPARQVSLLAVDVDGETRLPKGWRGPLNGDWPLDELAQGERYVIEDLQAMEPATPVLQILQEEGVRCHISFPLLARGTLIGSLDLELAEPGEPLPEHVDTAHEMAFGLAITIQHIHLAEELQQYAQELEGKRVAGPPGAA
jgi:PAS domain S-box-containing protein